ncbi:potassium channel family protein [Auraticoccus monumenti]|uniref:potassium channel family protein n=1 Tax=Auraticoccus monumenti TaxID=675864 RepID=UPI000AEA0475|nr:TrkA family potassium uptake protein [Auraticoccus monumenti]
MVVIGLGRFGTALALELDRSGTEVLAIDQQPSVVQRLAGSLTRVVAVDSTDIDALREVGVADFERAVVAIGVDQQSSILTTALLSDLGVTDIWAKALNAQHAKILERVGARHIFQPEQEMGERVAHLLSGRMQDYLEIGKDWALVKTAPPRFLVGVPLGESRLRARFHVTVVSVKPEGRDGFTYADNATTLRYGDQILVVGTVAAIERFTDEI